MRPARKEEPAGEEAGRKEKKGIASLRSRSNIDDSEMNSKQERQGNQPTTAVSATGGKEKQRGKNNDDYAIASSRPSHRRGVTSSKP